MSFFLNKNFRYSSRQFGVWRVLFGSYLVFYYVKLLCYSTELWSRDGVLPQGPPYLGHSYVPAFLFHFDSPTIVSAIIATCALSALFFTLGVLRKPAVVVFWLLNMWLYNRNPLTDTPEYCFVNWLLVATLLIPSGEEFSLTRYRDKNWKMPRAVYISAFAILALGYFFAGYEKFKGMDPSWRDGRAMFYVLVTDNARFGWYGHFFDNFPAIIFLPLTWGAILSQLLAPLLVSSKVIRPWWWAFSTLTHFALLFLVNLAQVSLGMFLFHLFLWDQSWFTQAGLIVDRARKQRGSRH